MESYIECRITEESVISMICPQCKTDNGSYGVTCYKCGANLQSGGGVATAVQPADAIFSLDRFFLNQKSFQIHEKYYVLDEQGNKLLFIEREFFKLYADIHFFTDETKSRKVMSLVKDKGLMGFGDFQAKFTLTMGNGQQVGIFQRQGLISSFLRRTWDITYPDGRTWAMAQEDSLVLAILRRYVRSLGDLFRTNFNIISGGRQIGRFDRKLTITDKYVMDLSGDPQKSFDRRMAIALAVLLDTAEHR